MQEDLVVRDRIKMFNKAQMKMVESVFVVIIFVVILMIGIVFFSRFQESDAQFRRIEQRLTESIQLAQVFASLPEISCSDGSVISDNCLDIMKLEAMDQLSRGDGLYYFDLFKYGTVTVEQLYPETEEEMKWVIYDRPRPDSGFFSMGVPMVIYDPTTGQEFFGLMEVRYYDG